MARKILLLALLTISLHVKAQEVSEVTLSPLTEIDETLFRVNGSSKGEDAYDEATKYYRSPVSQRRRGLDWWIAREILDGESSADEDYVAAVQLSRARLFASTRKYNVGGELTLSTLTVREWSLAADLDMRTGRDVNIMGVFSQNFRGEFSVGKRFDDDHYLDINLAMPLIMEGLQGSASQEAITLTGDNLYNPAWGYYDGEVRNSRVRRYRVPELNLRYQRPIGGSTIAAIQVNAKMGRSSLSRLGWYDGYNPTPDYYRKLPSYIASSSLKAEVEELWHNQNSDYTQIAWDDLVLTNQRSADGEAHYIIEDQVERITRGEAALLFSSKLGDKLHIHYGAKVNSTNTRHFKEMNDLLGAEYLTDIDQYIGDYSHLSNEMQNNLRDPNRKVKEGEEFGYNYTLRGINLTGIFGLEYRSNSLSVELSGAFSEAQTQRVGHYEKERFAGSLSYGGSSIVVLPTSNAAINIAYSLSGRHSLSLLAATHNIAPEAEDLFIQVQNADRIIDTPQSQNITSINLGYHYASPQFMVDVAGYFIRSRNQIDTWQAYDDLSYTYSDVVIRDIGFSSIGLEVVSHYEVSRELRLDATIALGDYTYDTTPTISLYDDTDMSLYSTSEAQAVVGCKVGNAPQLLTTLGATYFTANSFILSLDCSYAAGRYIAPSFMRRSDRVIRGTGSPEMEQEIVTQSNLGAVFDLSAAVTKTFWLHDDNRISLSLRINNLLGDRDRIDYGRESNRILRNSASSDTGAYYLQPHTYYYETPRTLYFSCNYLF